MQWYGTNVLLHLPHPPGLRLDTVHCQHAGAADVGNPVVIETHRSERCGHHLVVQHRDVRELFIGAEVLARIQSRYSDQRLYRTKGRTRLIY